jgi:hypothetical protein
LSGPITGENQGMQIRKIIQRRIRRSASGVQFNGDVNAAIAGNIGEPSSHTRVSSRSTVSAQSSRGHKGGSGDAGQGEELAHD